MNFKTYTVRNKLGLFIATAATWAQDFVYKVRCVSPSQWWPRLGWKARRSLIRRLQPSSLAVPVARLEDIYFSGQILVGGKECVSGIRYDFNAFLSNLW